MELKPSTGAIKSTPDSRDLVFSASNTSECPDTVETNLGDMKVLYQAKVGACTACALVKIIEHLYWKKTGVRVEFSARFLYNVTKKLVDFNLDEGSSMRNALKAAQKYGVLPEKDCPSNFNVKHEEFLNLTLTPEMLKNALNWRIGAYTSVPIEESLLHYALWKNEVLYERYEVGPEWYTPTWFEKDILPLKKSKTIDSGHAVFRYKNESVDDKVTIRNSWSERWGKKGDGYYFYKDYKPTEAWIVTLDPVPEIKGDNTAMVEEGTWRKFLQILRDLKVIK